MTVMGAATQYTFEQFEQLPDTAGKRELLEGELIEMPPAKLGHTLIAHGLLKMLREIAGARGLTVLMEAGFRVGRRTYLQPDLAVLRNEVLAEADRDGYLERVPSLAIEIVSPANTLAAIDQKVKMYVAQGADEVWILYPKSRSVSVYRRGDAAAIVHEAAFSSDVLGATFSVADIFDAKAPE